MPSTTRTTRRLVSATKNAPVCLRRSERLQRRAQGRRADAPCAILNLPSDVFRQIAKELAQDEACRSSLLNLALACKTTFAHTFPALLERVDFGKPSSLLNFLHDELETGKFDFVKHLVFNVTGLTEFIVDAVRLCRANLRSLRVKFRDSNVTDIWPAVATCEALTELDISDTMFASSYHPLQDTDPIAFPPNLRTIHVGLYGVDGDVAAREGQMRLIRHVANAPQIRDVRVTVWDDFLRRSPIGDVPEFCAKITELECNQSTLESIMAGPGLPSLKKLAFWTTLNQSIDFTAPLLPKLDCIWLSHLKGSQMEGILALMRKDAVIMLPQLQWDVKTPEEVERIRLTIGSQRIYVGSVIENRRGFQDFEKLVPSIKKHTALYMFNAMEWP